METQLEQTGQSTVGFREDHINSAARVPTDIVLRACREVYADDDELACLVKAHHGYCTARRAVANSYAAEVDLDPGLIMRVWLGKASADQVEKYRRQVSPFMAALVKANRVSYADTKVGRLIWEALDVAKRRSARGKGLLVWIQGDAGIGKTTIAKAWAQANNHGSSCVYEPRGAGGVKTMAKDLAEARGLDNGMNYDRLLRRLFASFEPGIVLIVDEAHLLVNEDTSAKQPKLDFLRRLSDVTGCAVVFLDTDQQVEVGLRTSKYNDKQLWRRMGRIVDLPAALDADDIRALCGYRFPRLELDDALLTVLEAVNEHPKGGFGQIGILLDDAQDYALDNGRHTPTKRDILVCAQQKLGSLDRIHATTKKRG
jgi:DNA transposition AAA+ family ATPase